MYYVYFLKSLKNDDIYIGSCEDVSIRIRRHNQGRVKSTKGYRPWRLLGIEEYQTRAESVKKEKFYKTQIQRQIIKQRYLNQ